MGGDDVPNDYIVKPVEKAIQVLRCVSIASSPMALKEISSRVDLPKTTVFRYLHTLRACGLIAHDPDRGLYRIDAGILSLVPQGGGLQHLRGIAVPYMQALQKRWNETVNLGIVEGTNIVYVEIFESQRALRMQARVGGRDPIHTTAIGKAILAHLPDDLARQILPPRLRKRTTRTVSSAATLAGELEPEPIKDWSLTSLKEKLIKIGAKVVNHGRYFALQMAEVAVPRVLFAEILGLIAELRRPPDPAPA
jgi:DNA-binding IclR family transcriptional regulator